MAYNRFTLPEAEAQLSLNIERDMSLFGATPTAAPSDFLRRFGSGYGIVYFMQNRKSFIHLTAISVAGAYSELLGCNKSKSSIAPSTIEEYKSQMMPIPTGTFLMGCEASEHDEEKPAHQVSISGFFMGSTPVTVAMWKEFCTKTGHKMPELPPIYLRPVWKNGWDSVLNHPIVNISWDECTAYTDWAGLRLPTEAEWEYAARGSEEGLQFPWGNSMDTSKCWCNKTSNGNGTAPINRPNNVFVNSYGLSDMSGNVWEWCFDWYDPNFYTNSAVMQIDPINKFSAHSQRLPFESTNSPARVIRGGHYNDGEYALRCACRIYSNPAEGSDTIGFRCVSTSK